MITIVSKQKNRKGLILFIHGFTGGKGTWQAPGHLAFPEILLTNCDIAENYDLAYFEYFTRLSTLLNSASNIYEKLKRVVFKKSH